MGRRGLIAAISASVAVALWSVSAIIAGIVAILRNAKYLNDVTIPSLIIAGALVSRRSRSRGGSDGG